jgi:dTDP-4-amino-4,6-dideoxygalactose transaminase
MEVAGRHGLIVIEDACQAHGAEYKGRRVGSIGDMGCFSFYPGKNLGAYGEGGMVITSNRKYEEDIRMLRDWGAQSKYRHVLKGFNYRMEGIQGAVLRVKLRHLEKWTEARRAAATRYNQLLENTKIGIPVELPCNRHVYHIYAIRVPQREIFQKALNDEQIQCGIHYPIPVHLQPAYADLGYVEGDFPHTEAAADEVLSLPMFAELTSAQQERVAATVNATFAEVIKNSIENALFPVNEEQDQDITTAVVAA